MQNFIICVMCFRLMCYGYIIVLPHVFCSFHFLFSALCHFFSSVSLIRECEEECIGESCRTFAERFREHMRAPLPIHDHFNVTGHEVSLDNFSIVGREDQSIARAIREAMLIRVNDPSLNRNIGKYQMPHKWDEVLVKSPELKLK